MDKAMMLIGMICAAAVSIYAYFAKRELDDANRELRQKKVDETLSKIETEVMDASIDDLNARNEKRYSSRISKTK